MASLFIACLKSDTAQEPGAGYDVRGCRPALLTGTCACWWTTKLNTSQHYTAARKANPTPATSTQALPAEVEMQSSHSTQHFSGHTWSTVPSSGPHNWKNTWTDWRGSKGGP